MAHIHYSAKINLVIISSFTIILMIILSAITIIGLFLIVTIVRIMQISHLESRISQLSSVINTTQLKVHLQTIAISSVEIDAEVAALKADIIKAAQKHHLKLDQEATLTENMPAPKEPGQLIKLVEKREDVAARVG